MSIFAANIAVSGFGRVVLFSLLATQLVVWLLEIRAVGFRKRMRESSRRSYFGYLRAYGRREWRLFAIVFGATLFIFTLIWR